MPDIFLYPGSANQTDVTLRNPTTSGAGASYTLVANAGVFTLTGNVAGLRAARKLVAAKGTFILTGNPVTLTYSGAGGGGGVAYSAWYSPVTDGQQVRLTLGAGWKFQ